MPDATFKDFVIDQLRVFGGAGARAMFGGFGVYKGGVMFGLIAFDELYLKVDDTNRGDYEARKSHPFVYEGKGKPITMSYWRIPDDVLEDPDELKNWAMKAYDVALRTKKPAPAQPRRRFHGVRRSRR
jgi:DNA transformation protein and related proteins